MCRGGKEAGRKGKRRTLEEKEAAGWVRDEGWGSQGTPALTLPTLNGVDLADSIADSAAEAGQPGCSPLHLGHGALEPGLKAGGHTRS